MEEEIGLFHRVPVLMHVPPHFLCDFQEEALVVIFVSCAFTARNLVASSVPSFIHFKHILFCMCPSTIFVALGFSYKSSTHKSITIVFYFFTRVISAS